MWGCLSNRPVACDLAPPVRQGGGIVPTDDIGQSAPGIARPAEPATYLESLPLIHAESATVRMAAMAAWHRKASTVAGASGWVASVRSIVTTVTRPSGRCLAWPR